jgi:hypothetical protein
MPALTYGYRAVLAGTVLVAPMLAVPARAQTPVQGGGGTVAHVAADTVASSSAFVQSGERHSVSMLDVLGAWRVASGVEVILRPVLQRDYFGNWQADLYQLAVRYDTGTRVRSRIEAGYLPSPIGLAPLESRADANPLVAPVTAYTSFLPSFEAGTPTTQLSSPLYPLAAQATVSARYWDVRGAVLDSSLVRVRPLTGDNKPPRAPQVAVGGGVTPHIGLRLGASFARGRFARASEVADRTRGDRMATVVGVDGDYSIGYTRVYGEWIRTSFDRATGRAAASGITLTAVRTLAPRWFLAGRAQRLTTSHMVIKRVAEVEDYGNGYLHQDAPTWADLGPQDALSLETALGYRLSPE